MKVGRDRWPEALLLVRHGESAGNVARDDAEARGLATIDIAERDMDVPLSATGCEQAAAAGALVGERGEPPADSRRVITVRADPRDGPRLAGRIGIDRRRVGC